MTGNQKYTTISLEIAVLVFRVKGTIKQKEKRKPVRLKRWCRIAM